MTLQLPSLNRNKVMKNIRKRIKWLKHTKAMYLYFILNGHLNHTLRTRPDDV